MEHQSIVIAAGLVGVAAAVRSAWSPCSLSMLSMLTPFGERGRGNSYAVSATTFLVGAVLGGACLGLLPAAAAFALHTAELGTPQVAAVSVAFAMLTIAGDLGWFPLPRVPRQVNESWFGQYRAWVYGVGYGWQLGTGVTTYVMTSAVYLTVVLAALTTSPLIAMVVCTGFGAIRGVTILLGVRLVDPEAIRLLHQRFDVAEPLSRGLAVIAPVSALAIGVAQFAPTWLAAAVGAVLLAPTLSARRMPSRVASVS